MNLQLPDSGTVKNNGTMFPCRHTHDGICCHCLVLVHLAQNRIADGKQALKRLQSMDPDCCCMCDNQRLSHLQHTCTQCLTGL